jgi:hypothetical protein
MELAFNRQIIGGTRLSFNWFVEKIPRGGLSM